MSRTPSTSPAHHRALMEQSNGASNSYNSSSRRADSSSWKGVAQRRCLSCHSLACSCPTRHQLDPEEKKRRIDAISASTEFGKRKLGNLRADIIREESKGRAAIVREAAAIGELFTLECEERHARAYISREELWALTWVSGWVDVFNTCIANLRVFSSAHIKKLEDCSAELLLEHETYLIGINESLDDLTLRERTTLQALHGLVEEETKSRAKIANESHHLLLAMHNVAIPAGKEECLSAQRAKARCRSDLESFCAESYRHLCVEESIDRQRLSAAFSVERDQRQEWVASKHAQRVGFDNECLRERAVLAADCDAHLRRLSLIEGGERTSLIAAESTRREQRVAVQREALDALIKCRSDESSEWHTLILAFQEEGDNRYRWECARHDERSNFEAIAQAAICAIFEDAIAQSQSTWDRWCELLKKYQADLSAQIAGLQFIEEGERRGIAVLEADTMDSINSLERSSRGRVAHFTRMKLILSLETREQVARSTLEQTQEEYFKSIVSLCHEVGVDAASCHVASIQERITKVQRHEKQTRRQVEADADTAHVSIVALFNEAMPKMETEEVRMLRQSIASQINLSYEGYTMEYVRTGRVAPTVGQRAPLDDTPFEALLVLQQTLQAADALDSRVNTQLCAAKRSSDVATKQNNKLRAIIRALKEKRIWTREMRDKGAVRLSDAKTNRKSIKLQACNNLRMTRERAAASSKAVAAARNDLEDLKDRVRERLRGGSSKAASKAPRTTGAGAKRQR